MAEPFIGEIRMFAGTFAPRAHALCDGQLLTISQNDALFSLLGTTYGGDGRTTFGLPDLRGRLPIHQGTGAGLSARRIGDRFGVERAGIRVDQLPQHSHAAQFSTAPGVQANPGLAVLATSAGVRVYRPAAPTAELNGESIALLGGDQSHENVMPFLCINFVIALTGVFPSRN